MVLKRVEDIECFWVKYSQSPTPFLDPQWTASIKRKSIRPLSVAFVTWNFILLIKTGNGFFILERDTFYSFLGVFVYMEEVFVISRKPPNMQGKKLVLVWWNHDFQTPFINEEADIACCNRSLSFFTCIIRILTRKVISLIFFFFFSPQIFHGNTSSMAVGLLCVFFFSRQWKICWATFF